MSASLFTTCTSIHSCILYNATTTALISSSNDQKVAESDSTATPVNIEKLVKLFKTHRCAMDFDSAFCKAVFLPVNDDDRIGQARLVVVVF